MSTLFSLIVLSAPLFSWGDSLYLDAPRLGKVEFFSESGRTSHWIYTDIAVLERNASSGWRIGLRPVALADQKVITRLADSSNVTYEAAADLKPAISYWVGDSLYEVQLYRGPWSEIDALLFRTTPSFMIDVRDEPVGAGTKAVHGTLYWGETPVFRSVSGIYQLAAPAAASGVGRYLEALAARQSVSVDELTVNGILYLQGDFPLVFYVLGSN